MFDLRDQKAPGNADERKMILGDGPSIYDQSLNVRGGGTLIPFISAALGSGAILWDEAAPSIWGYEDENS